MSDLMDHRITRAVTALQERIDGLDPAALARVEASAEFTHDEWFAMGSIPSAALMAQVLTAPEAQMLHAIHTDYTERPLAERVIFMQTVGELVKAGIR